jgi:hypothetical protein
MTRLVLIDDLGSFSVLDCTLFAGNVLKTCPIYRENVLMEYGTLMMKECS